MLATHRAAGALLPLFLACSCGESPSAVPGPGVDPGAQAGGQGPLALVRLTNRADQLLPHRVMELDGAGNPTGQILDIRSLIQISAHVRASNPVLPTPTFSTTATLPSGRAGNQSFRADFTGAIEPGSVFDLGGTTPALSDALRITAYDPTTGQTTDVGARVFVGGVTAVSDPAGARLERWAAPDEGTSRVVLLRPEAEGFPGRRSELADPRTLLIVADTDGDLTTFETFPTSVQIGVEFGPALTSIVGQSLGDPAFVSTTTGPDTIAPTVVPGPPPAITPLDGAVDVDPETEVTVRFTEPVQPFSVGAIEGTGIPLLSSAVSLAFGPPQARNEVPFNVEPVSPYNLASYVLRPANAFPGAAPTGPAVNDFNRVDVTVLPGGAIDLAAGSMGVSAQTMTTFLVGIGTGVVNAPVTPDAIYLGRSGAAGGGLSVVDLNGFGASTGNPVSGPVFPGEGESRYPWNPNVRFNLNLRPPLAPGTSTIDGGSAGVFTLTLDSSLQDSLVSAPLVVSIVDMHIGQPLDTTMRNAPPPFGCQSGGGDICALDGLKVIVRELSPSGAAFPGQMTAIGGLTPGYGNLVSWAPHPNPPPMSFPGLCVAPGIASIEPTSVDSLAGGFQNLLVPGNPFADPAAMIPPTGLLARWQNAFFQGPSYGQTQVSSCSAYMIREQVGHFLYVADPVRGEVVVLHSNRMQVIDRIQAPDATDIAVGPNLDLVAVTSPAADQVRFIDINPASSTFHQVVQTTNVGDGPRGVAWQSDNEDILVCNELDGTLSILSAASLQVRKTVSVGPFSPFDVAVAPRQTDFSFQRGVYFAYVLTREGVVAVFESGPNGVNGWGYDDVVGTLPYRFLAPKAIQPAMGIQGAGLLVAHEGPLNPITGVPGSLGDGAITEIQIGSGIVGLLPLVSGQPPQIRDLDYEIVRSIAESTGQLSGTPVDLAFDDLTNRGAFRNQVTIFSIGAPLPANGKGLVRRFGPLTTSSNEPSYLFAAVPGAGVVDVLSIGLAGTPRVDVNSYAPGTQSIRAPGTNVLASYWRQ